MSRLLFFTPLLTVSSRVLNLWRTWDSSPLKYTYLHLSFYLGTPCDEDGNDLLPGTPPPPPSPPPVDETGQPLPFFPYRDREEFKLANLLFKRNQMPGTEIDELLQIWADTLLRDQDHPPFADHNDLYNTIDATILGDAPWQSFSITYSGKLPVGGNIPPWMLGEYDIWFRDPKVVLQNQLANPDFKDEFDYAPFQRFDDHGEREWKDFMSANWVNQQAVRTLLCYISLLFEIIFDMFIEHNRESPPMPWFFICPSYSGKR